MPESVRLQGGDFRKLEFEDDRFELVVCFEVIEYVEDPLTVLDELVRVLAPGGLLLVSAPNRGAHQPGNPYQPHEFDARRAGGRLGRQTEPRAIAPTARLRRLGADGSDAADRHEAGEPSEDDLVLQKLSADTSGGRDLHDRCWRATRSFLPCATLAAMGGTASLREWLSVL